MPAWKNRDAEGRGRYSSRHPSAGEYEENLDMPERDTDARQEKSRVQAQRRIDRLTRTATSLQENSEAPYDTDPEQDLEAVADELDRLLSERQSLAKRASKEVVSEGAASSHARSATSDGRSPRKAAASPKSANAPAQGSKRLEEVMGALERLDAKVARLSETEAEEARLPEQDFAPEAFEDAADSSEAETDAFDDYDDDDSYRGYEDERPVAGRPALRERLSSKTSMGQSSSTRLYGRAHEGDTAGNMSPRSYRDLSRRIDSLRKPQEETMMAMREGLGSLRDAISGYAAGNQERSSRHNSELRHLSEMVERLRADRQDDSQLREMQKEVSEVKALLGRSNVDGALKSLEHGYAHILQRLDELNRGAVDPRVLHGITTRLNEIEDAFAVLPRGEHMQSLEDRIGDISERVEDLITSHRPTDIEPLKMELQDLRAVVTKIDFTDLVESIDNRLRFVSSRLDELETLAREQRGMNTRIAAMEERLPDAEMLGRLQGRLEDIVGMLSEDRTPPESARFDEIAGRLERMERNTPKPQSAEASSEAMSALERKLEKISSKIDLIEKRSNRPVPVLDASASKSASLSDDNLRLLGDLQKRIGDLSEQLSQPADSVTTADLDLLRKEIGEMRASFSAPPQTEKLEQRIAELAETLAADRGQLDDSRLDQLGAKVAQLAEHLENSAERDEDTARISSALARIEDNLKATRDDVVVMAKKAAREVAEGVVAGQPQTRSTEYDDAIEGLQGDLRKLLQAAQGSEERTRNTFDGVQSVLSALTDRLEHLEKTDGPVSGASSVAAAGRMGAFLKREPDAAGAKPTAPVTTGKDDRPGERVRDRKADFIAAARRAAQAASEEAAQLEQQSRKEAPAKVKAAKPARKAAKEAIETPVAASAPERGEARGNWLRNTLKRGEKDTEAGTAVQDDLDARPSGSLYAGKSETGNADNELHMRERVSVLDDEQSGSEGGKGRRRALMFAAAAVVLALGTLQIARMVMPSSQDVAATDVPAMEDQMGVVGSNASGLNEQGTPLSTAETNTAALPKRVQVPLEPIVEPDGLDAEIAEAPEVGSSSEMANMDVASEPELAREMEDAPAAQAGSDLAFATPNAPQAIGEAEPVPAGSFSQTTQQSSPVNLSTPLPPAELGSVALRTAAARGDAAAAFLVGVKYTEGQGVPANLEEAAKWYQRSAEQGLAPAQYRLASLYEKGRGTERNRIKARDWYTKAAEAGNAKSMHNLAVLYAEGVEGTPDFAQAAKWFELAANYGIKDSLFNLGILYARGLGVEKDLVASYKWFAVAAEQGDQDAAQKRDEIANMLDQENLANARLAVENFALKTPAENANKVIPDPAWAESTGFSTDASTLMDDVTDYTSLVKQVQFHLNRLGYEAGEPDGAIGPRTRTAIRAFQRNSGSSETGEADADLLKALERRDA
ncbi:SEL1-like repeat protein [Roseibium sp. CAU 1637]|uniref:SEL1-like repeat protein n=1 Tax=Roseibium limicola TaxID=2816037 RepID=A0A939J6S7_9HYPH|nr:peptidoglycan-binding protein [Roseibium limicola]MBO0345427.1 SEL1-like repeat protein [Roseibium limicola]